MSWKTILQTAVLALSLTMFSFSAPYADGKKDDLAVNDVEGKF